MARALAAHQAGRLEEAEQRYRDVLERYPSHADALHLLGLVAQQRGESVEAARCVERAIAADPGQAHYHHNLGEICRSAGRMSAAIAAYRHALSLRPEYPAALLGLGAALRAEGQLREALGCFEQALSIDSSMIDAHIQRACVLAALGQHDEAIAVFREVRTLAPENLEAWVGLGDVHQANGELDEAAKAYRRGIAADAKSGLAHRRLGRLLHEHGKPGEALAHLRHGVDRDPQDAQAWHELGLALEATGAGGDAVQAYGKALGLDGDAAPVWSDLGVAWMNQGDADQAVECFRKAIACDPQYTVALENLARARRYTESDASELAELEALEASSELSDSARISLHFALGKIYDDCRSYDRAFEHYSEANRLKRSTLAFCPDALVNAVEQLERVFDAPFFDAHRDHGSSSRRPIFIIGMPRTGTTLCEQIIAAHPRVTGGGELHHIDAVADGLSARLGVATRYPACAAGLDAAVVEACAEQYLAALRGLDATAEHVSDKLPTNFFHLGLVATLFPRVRVVHCRRSALDTCVSIYFQHFASGNEWSYDLKDIARFYLQYTRLMSHWRSVLPRPPYEVRYERLIGAPSRLIPELVEAVGLDWDPACSRFYESARVVATASNWQVRQPIYQASVGRWRHYEGYLGPLRDMLGEHCEESGQI